jgi:hypothetical protein
VDVLLHVRRADVIWFHSSSDHKKELLKLLSQQIVPKEFDEEIDRYHELHNRLLHRPGPTTIGEKNQKGKGGKAGRKRKVTEPEPKPERQKRDVCHVFGDNLRVTYRVEEFNTSESATLIFAAKRTGSPKGASLFRQLPKLSKRISLWCYPMDKNNPEEPVPEGGGFPRPEMMPIASLFRPPYTDDA